MDRRQFLGTVAAAAGSRALAQGLAWPSPVLDVHFYPRHGEDREIDHLHGAGIARAVSLPGLGSEDRVKKVMAEYPAQFVRFANADVRLPDAIGNLRAQLAGGAIG